jgi:hypothetical protein
MRILSFLILTASISLSLVAGKDEFEAIRFLRGTTTNTLQEAELRTDSPVPGTPVCNCDIDGCPDDVDDTEAYQSEAGDKSRQTQSTVTTIKELVVPLKRQQKEPQSPADLSPNWREDAGQFPQVVTSAKRKFGKPFQAAQIAAIGTKKPLCRRK